MQSITAPSWAPEATVTAACGLMCADRLPALNLGAAGRDPEVLSEVLLHGQFQIDALISEFERSVSGRDDTNAVTMRAMAAALRAVSTRIGQAEIH